jgi:hypothetical protein
VVLWRLRGVVAFWQAIQAERGSRVGVQTKS